MVMLMVSPLPSELHNPTKHYRGPARGSVGAALARLVQEEEETPL